MRLIDADALMDDIKRDSKKAIDDGDKVGSFWLGYIAGLVIKQPTIQPEVLACGNGELIAKPELTDEQVIDYCGKKGCKIVADDLFDLLSKSEPQWIPVSERLPRDGSWNIFTDGKNISVERYKADAIDHFFPAGRWFQLEDVIAWMPLPTPYTK